MFCSTVFPHIYPEDKTKRFNNMMRAADYLVEHQVQSGMSFGVFDLEYEYKRPQSAATGGRFYWDPEDDTVTRDELIEAMDFPLVTVALAYDGFNTVDMEKLMPLIHILPVFGTTFAALNALDKRDPESWKAKAPREVLMRMATSTRQDYEGKGLMGALARFLMREAKLKGFKAVNIECMNDAVTYVWSQPPSPFKGEIVAEFHTDKFENEDENGKKVKPFAPAKQRITRVYTSL